MTSPTKVLFITQDDPIYVAEFWEEFITLLNNHNKGEIEITGLITLQTLGKATPGDLFKRVYGMYGFFGTAKLLSKLALSKFRNRNIDNYANTLNVTHIRSNSLKSGNIMDMARGSDIIFSVAASLKFHEELLNAPKKGCFNIHSGPLPQYQGMMPVFWQMRDGKTNIGITIHQMDMAIDTGKIIRQEFTDINDCKTLDRAIRKTKRAGARLVVDFLNDLPKSTKSDARVLDPQSSYFSFPKRKDVRAFESRGLKLI